MRIALRRTLALLYRMDNKVLREAYVLMTENVQR